MRRALSGFRGDRSKNRDMPASQRSRSEVLRSRYSATSGWGRMRNLSSWTPSTTMAATSSGLMAGPGPVSRWNRAASGVSTTNGHTADTRMLAWRYVMAIHSAKARDAVLVTV